MLITAYNKCGNSPQTVSIRHKFTHKKAPLPKNYIELWGGGADAPSASPGSATAALLTNERMVSGRKGPGYLERKFQGRNGPGNNGPRRERSAVFIRLGNEWSRERMFQGTNILENESSRERMVPRTKVPSWERMFQGTNSRENEYS